MARAPHLSNRAHVRQPVGDVDAVNGLVMRGNASVVPDKMLQKSGGGEPRPYLSVASHSYVANLRAVSKCSRNSVLAARFWGAAAGCYLAPGLITLNTCL